MKQEGRAGGKALYAGSFDPFTIGHKNIVDRALGSVAREVVIAIGVNCGKTCAHSPESRLREIQRIYEGNPRVQVVVYEGLTTDFATHVGADFLLRGVRNVRDFEAEREMAEINRRLTGIETVLLLSEPQLACISSSMVRELTFHHKDTKEFLP